MDLYFKLSKMTFSGNSVVRLSSNENGYAVSIVALVVFCIESLVNKLKYHKKLDVKNNLDFLEENYGTFSPLWKKLNEFMTLRNAIAHNHIWKIEYETDEKWNELNVEKELLDGYGRGAFSSVVDMSSKTTKLLKLRIIPTRIGKAEAQQAIVLLDEFSDFLDKINFSLISHEHFEFEGKVLTLKEISEVIKNKH
jgi:hypothetical protein